MSEHAPEPWKWDAGDIGAAYSMPYCIVYVDDEVTITKDLSPANARRIVACVNACQGISTEVLEGGVKAVGPLTVRDLIEVANEAKARAEEAVRMLTESVEWMEAVLATFAAGGAREDKGEEHLAKQIFEIRAFLEDKSPGLAGDGT